MNGEPETPLDDTVSDLAQRLPGLIETVLRRYLEFTSNKPPTEPRAFAAYSAASRAAMAHLEQLLKLANALNGEAPAAQEAGNIDRLIADAEAALEKTAADT